MTASPFFQACGGHDPIRFADGREFAVPVLLAGRHPRADLVLPDGPDKAILFVLVEGGLYFVPLVEGHGSPRWVSESDVFEVPGTILQPLNPRQPDCENATGDPLSSGGARHTDLHLEPGPAFRSRRSPTRLPVLPRLTLIGRGEPARFKINRDGIDPLHAVILRTDAGPWLADLSLRQATLVNDGPVTAARLRSGDRIVLGEVDLVAHVSGESAPRHAVAPTADSVGPILQQVAQFQQQTFEQFREMLGSVTEMMGSLMQEHRSFVREELARIERTAQPPAPPAKPQLRVAPAPPQEFTPPETITPITAGPGESAPPPNAGLHLWLQEQIGNLEKSQSNRWQRLVERFRKK